MPIGLKRQSRLLFLLGILSGFPCGQAADAEVLTFKAGVGYELLSQEFFSESIADTSTDPLFDTYSLKTNYLDDFKGIFEIRLSPMDDGRLDLRARYEQTTDILRARFTGDYFAKAGKTKWAFHTEVDVRNRYQDSAGAGDSYLFGQIRSKVTFPVSNSGNLSLRLTGDLIEFDSTGDFTFSYQRLSGSIEWEQIMAGFSSVGFRLFALGRSVPDSSDLGFASFGLESRYFGFFSRSDLEVFLRLENKRYNFSDNRNNFRRAEFELNHRLRFESLFARQEIGLEATIYDPANPVNFNYYQADLALMVGLQNGLSSFSVGPVIEILTESEGDLNGGEDYFEYGGRLDLDYMNLDRLFFSAESTLGFRRLSEATDFQSSFTFERLSLIADLKISSQTSLNLLFSGEWEWHKNSAENSRIFLLATSLNHSF